MSSSTPGPCAPVISVPPQNAAELCGCESTGAKSASARSDAPPIEEYYSKLFSAYGPQHWWPGRGAFEIIAGAILVQNTSWINAAKAIAELRRARMLTWAAMNEAAQEELERLIKPSGYYRQKARTLKAFCAFLEKEYGGSLKKMWATAAIDTRQKLLSVHGFGPETVDSVLLYAGNQPVFPVDAYARRMLVRHGWIEENAKYDDVRAIFEGAFPGDAARLNEMHALIVHTGKHFCRKQKPLCGECPLGGFLNEGR
jgi:endonuclease III related protein